jgi:DNA replication protein
LLDKPSKFTAHFAADLYMEGNVSIPVMLLKHYKQLNIGETELVLLLHLISKSQLDNNYFPSCEDLANFMTIDSLTIKSMIAGLIEKGILMVERRFDVVSGDWVNYYSTQSLFEKLADFWILEKTDEKKNAQYKSSLEKETLAQIYKTFEREFGRLLSPMEISQIAEWYKGNKYSPELIYEALKRAVLRNVLNFKYIDSILKDWDKNNIRSVKQVEAHDKMFQKSNPSGKTTKSKIPVKNLNDKEKDKYKNLYLS